MKFLRRTFLLGNIILIVITIGAYLAPYFSPESMEIFSFLGLVLPALLLVNFGYILFWLWFKPKYAWGSSLILLLGINSMSKIFNYSFEGSREINHSSLKIGTFNMQFSKAVTTKGRKNQPKLEIEFNKYLGKLKDLEVLCVQECGNRSQKYIQQALNFPYQHFLKNSKVGIYSKHKIINQGYVDIGETTLFACIWVDLAIERDTFRVYATHLQANRADGKIPSGYVMADASNNKEIAKREKENMVKKKVIPPLPITKTNTTTNTLVKEKKVKEKPKPRIAPKPIPAQKKKGNNTLIINPDSKEQLDLNAFYGIFKNYARLTSKRIEQATLIKVHQKKSPYPSIICGDFNDTPQSFLYTLLNEGMKDSFDEKGSGLGTTRQGMVPALRIDYILADPALTIFSHDIIKGKFSDHYVITSEIQLN